MIHRRALLAVAFVLPVGIAEAQTTGPAAPVMALNQGLQAVRKAGKSAPFADRAATLTPVVSRAFSLETVLRASVGPRYGSLPADQKAALLKVFTEYTVASYVANFDTDSGERFVVEPQTRAVGADQVVATQIVPVTGNPTELDYVVRQGAEGWRIVDVLFGGNISQVAVQRSDFRSLLSSNSAERLIATLKSKTAMLAAGGKG